MTVLVSDVLVVEFVVFTVLCFVVIAVVKTTDFAVVSLEVVPSDNTKLFDVVEVVDVVVVEAGVDVVISSHFIPSPVNPALQKHENIPLKFVHEAFQGC